ncbi:MAG: hypothetical protein R3B48_08545 [Kofleriaceae bacterium]
MPAADGASTAGLDASPGEAKRSGVGGAVENVSASRWTLFGYLRAQLAVVQNDPNVAFVGRDDGFALQHARLGVRGRPAPRVEVELSLDGAVDEREVNAPNGELRVGLRDARVELDLGAGWTARVGRFEIWFDPDGAPDPDRPFIDRALPSRGVRATEGWQTQGLPPGRSLGVAARWSAAAAEGAPPPLALELAAQNGADEFASGNDNDALALSVAARAEARLGWAQLAGRWNPRTEGDQPFRQEETDLQASLGVGTILGPVRLAAGAVLVRTTFATTGGPSQRSWGAHGQGLATVPAPWPLEVGYRFAILDPSSLVLTDRLMEHTLGAVLALPTWRLRLLLNATHAVEQDQRELTNDRLEALLEVRL